MKDPLAGITGYVLRRAAATALAELNLRLAPLRLRHADVAMLMLVAKCPGISQSQAGRVLDIQRANMTPFIGRLERRGVLHRQRVDGRSQKLQLTPAGRMLLDQATRIVKGHEATLRARVPHRLRPMVLPVLLALWGQPTRDA
jgi:DNA-binding MarR family transcriptional regulator